MKTYLSLAWLCSALVAATACGAEPPAPRRGYVHSVGEVQHHNGAIITRGSSSMEVLQALGQPARWLDANTWVYTGYSGTNAPANDRCRLLVIGLRDGHVVDLKVGCPNAIEIIASSLQKKIPADVLVTKVETGGGSSP